MVKLLGLITVVSSAMISHSSGADTVQVAAAGPDINGDSTTGDDLTAATDLDDALLDFAGANSIVTGGQVEVLLAGGNLTLAAVNTLTVDDAIDWNAATQLSLSANTVALNQAVTSATGTAAISIANTAVGAFNLNADLNTTSTSVTSANSFDAAFNINSLPAGMVVLSATGSADSLSVAGLVGAPVTITASGANTGSLAGGVVSYSGVDSVVGRAGDTFDAGANAFDAGVGINGGVNVSVFNNVVASSLNLTAGTDSFTVTGVGAGNMGGINYTGLSTVDALGGSDTLVNATGVAMTVGSQTVGGVAGSNFTNISTPALNLTGGVDNFTLTGSNAGSGGGFTYTGLSTIDALAGSDTLNTNAATTLTGITGQVASNGVTISNVENLVSTDGNLVATGGGDSINLTGANAGNAYSVQFSGISELDAGGGTDVLNTNAAVNLTGVANEITSNGVTVSNIETVSATNTVLNGSTGADVIQLGATGVVANGVTITGITTINGGDGSDQLDVTNVASMNGVTFNGGGPTGSDSILISDTSAVTTVTHTFINENDGSINADGALLNYTGLEPVIDNLNATNRNFNFTGGAETITLQNDAGAGMMNIDSTLGESVTFTNPTSSLSIETGSGDDILTIAPLDAAFGGAINITDSAGNLDLAGVDIFNGANVTSITTAGNLTDSGNIAIAGATTLSAVDITLGGAGENTNFGNLTITATGNVTIQEDSVTNLVGANTAGSLNLTSTLGTLIGGSVTTTGEQVYNSPVFLSGNTTLSAADTDADAEGIDFGSTVAGSGNNLNITGGAGFASTVSSVDALTADHIDSESTISATSVNVTGTSDLGGNVTTSSDQTYIGNVLLTANVELDGNNVSAGTIDAGGNTLTLDGATSVTTGAITNGALVTQTDTTIASFNGTSVNVTAGNLSVSGMLTASGAVTNNDTLTLTGINTAGSYVSNGGTLNSAGATLNAGSYDLNTGSIVNANLGNGVIEADGTVAINGNTGTGTFNVNTGTTTIGASSNIGGNTVVDFVAILTNGGSLGGNLTNDGTTGNTGSVAGATTNNGNLTNTGTGVLNGNVLNFGVLTTDTDGIIDTAFLANNGTINFTGMDTVANYVSSGGTLQTTGTAPNSAILTVNGSFVGGGTLSTGLTRIATTPGATLIVDVSTGGGVTAGQVELQGSTLDLTSTDASVVAEFGERYNIIRVNGPGEIINSDSGFVSTGFIGFDSFTTAGVGPGAVDVGDVLFDISTGDVVTLGAPLVIQDDTGKAITLATSSRGNSVNQRAIFNAVIAGAVDRDVSSGGSANFDGADGGLGTLLSGVLADPSNLDSLNSLSPEAYAGAVDYALHATRHYSEAARLGHGHGLTSGNYQVTAGYTSFGIGSGTSADDGDYDMDGNAGFIALRYRADGSNTSYGGFVGIDEGTIDGSFLDLDTEGFVLGAFVDHEFQYDGRNWNLWGNISYGSFEYSGNRMTMLNGMTQLNSVDSIDANTLELGVGANVEVYAENGLSVRPGVGFRFLHTTVDSFSETGSLSALSVSGMDYSSYLLDARVDVSYRPEGQKFGLNGHLGWQHDFSNGSRDVSASFASSNEFTVIAPGLDRDALTYGVGGFYDISDNMRIDLQYRGENRKNDNSFGVDLRFTIGF